MTYPNSRYLDMTSYKRKSHFNYFRTLAYPYVGLTVNVDVSGLLRSSKSRRMPFFLMVCYCVSCAANSVPEFRQRIVEDGIVEFAHCQTSHTVALEDGTYCYCTLRSDMPFETYLPYAVKEQEAAKQKRSIAEDCGTALGQIFVSTLPWVSFTALIQPVPIPADSNPRFTWGKYFTEGGQVKMPMTVLCHHALVDGIHIAAFFDELERQMKCTADAGV